MIYDIACNITDVMYDGIYNNVKKHENDIDNVLYRSHKENVIPFFVGNNYANSIKCLNIAQKYNTLCYAGIHPNDAYKHINEIDQVKEFIIENINKLNPTPNSNNLTFFKSPITNLIAVGECGLDYYRHTSCVKDQKYVFTSQLDLNCERYFLHSREAHRDMMEILCDYKHKGVIHSFDGTLEEAEEIIRLGYFIGINGHSLKKVDAVSGIDMNRVMIESDAPYCKMGKTYDGYKCIKTFFSDSKKYNKDVLFRRRNEPVNTVQVIEVLSSLWCIDIKELEDVIERNTKIFFDIP